MSSPVPVGLDVHVLRVIVVSVNIKGAAVNIKGAAVNIKGAALPGGGHRPQRLRGQVVEIMNENVRHFLSAINMSCDCSLHQIKFPAATLLKTKSYL